MEGRDENENRMLLALGKGKRAKTFLKTPPLGLSDQYQHRQGGKGTPAMVADGGKWGRFGAVVVLESVTDDSIPKKIRDGQKNELAYPKRSHR